MKGEKGMTLLEVVIAMVIFAMVVMYANSYMCTFIQAKRSVKEMTLATSLGNKVLDSLRMASYNTINSSSFSMGSKYTCTWNVVPVDSIKMKIVNLTVQWPAFNGKRNRAVNFSTNISDK